MSDTKLTAGIETQINIRPVRSQVFLVALICLTALSLIIGAILFYFGLDSGWIFVAIGLMFFIGSLWGWKQSQSDSDLDKAISTKIDLPDGTSVSTDPRVLRSPESAQALIQVLQEVLSRRPLPEPSGLVNEQLEVIQDSLPSAKAIVDKINTETQVKTNKVLDLFNLHDEQATVLQPNSQLEEPTKEELNKFSN